MSKILGLDLGTNSIGWAIRDLTEQDNQIIDKGVLTFEKGVGEGKSGEFPLVQKRTASRSKRRNYQAEKYRKWALLEALINNDMCPLTLPELDQWRKYVKGAGRKYPQSPSFIQWLRFDFNGDGKPDFENFGFSKHENHYLFRMLAASDEENHKEIFKNNPHILGRVLYHLVQRRGFRGRDDDENKDAKSIIKGSEETGVKGAKDIEPYIGRYKTLGAALYYLHNETGERIRKRYNLRTHYEKELQVICQVHRINDALYKKFWQAIIWQRPLRSQKGLIGLCTFEQQKIIKDGKEILTGKPRCPISHPIYEEYRAWVFINNLRIQLPDNIDRTSYIRENIYPLFSNIASRDFKLSAIVKELKKVGGHIRSRFDPDTKVVACTLHHAFKKLFSEDWKSILGWEAFLHNRPKNCPYSFEDIWHVLSTFDSKEKLVEFGLTKLCLDKKSADYLSQIKLQSGYATLSIAAIKKILPFLQQGLIYSHAVYLANLAKVLNKSKISSDEAIDVSFSLKTIFKQTGNEKLLAATVNGLISDQLSSDHRFGMDPHYELDQDDRKDIMVKLKETFGESTWLEKKTEQERESDIRFVTEKYLEFLRKPVTTKKDTLFIKPQRLHDRIYDHFIEKYNAPEENRKYLWHPSEQDIYPPARAKNGIPQLGDPQPISRGFKNPMALKTLHKLKGLVNCLLQSRKIDEDTTVVIEIARELNDANRRKAIEKWQREREKENNEYKKSISEMAEQSSVSIDVNSKDVIDKYRLWVEQNRTCLYTGTVISFSDLFSNGKYDFEHTIPASMSFDNELKNLTIADGVYNKQVKSNRFPAQLPNYEDDMNGYSAIRPRLQFMEEKVDQLESLLEDWKYKAKFASSKEIKDACIQRKHVIKMDLDYWRYKLNTFKLTEYKAGWRNSQLKDTQIVTKYALPYLKTVFNKVQVEKGEIMAIFKKIYELQPEDKKDRSRHSHHAEDAAVLTLIPPASIRDKILAKYNELKDKNLGLTYHEPIRHWPKFNVDHILSIRENVLINFQPQMRTLTPTYKKIRKRGKQQFVKERVDEGGRQYKLDEAGKKIPLIAKGDSIRGQLHKESFFGAIKRDGEICMVERYPIAVFTSVDDCKNIVDDAVREIVRNTLLARMEEGQSFDKAKLEPIPFLGGKAIIKKVRCKVAAGRGYLTPAKALEVNKHVFLSKHSYKQYAYAQNDENSLCLYYRADTDRIDESAFRIVGLFELSELKLNRIEDIRSEKFYQMIEVGRGKNKKEIPLSYVITAGIKVIFYKESMEELKGLSYKDLIRRIFRVYKFNDISSTKYIYLQNHLEARTDKELGSGSKDIDFSVYQPRLTLTADKFTCAIEGKDFFTSLDGQISWQF